MEREGAEAGNETWAVARKGAGTGVEKYWCCPAILIIAPCLSRGRGRDKGRGKARGRNRGRDKARGKTRGRVRGRDKARGKESCRGRVREGVEAGAGVAAETEAGAVGDATCLFTRLESLAWSQQGF